MKKREYFVLENNDLVKFLGLQGIAKNKAKTLVKWNCVLVNHQVVKKLPFDVKKGDSVVIEKQGTVNDSFDIIYEDSNYLVVNKKNGLLTISTSNINKDREVTLYRQVRAYLNQKREYAFIVNRIDKETSGLVIFVKNRALQEKLQSNWNEIVKRRGYVAVVTGKIDKGGRIDNYLYEDKMTFSHSTDFGGKRAITKYQPIRSNSRYTLLDVEIMTGRKNQIRVHMSEMGHAIVGDKKYHSKDNCMRRLMLHHYEIGLVDPISKKFLCFKSEVPDEFYYLFDNH